MGLKKCTRHIKSVFAIRDEPIKKLSQTKK
jgi:hypothetical protein